MWIKFDEKIKTRTENLKPGDVCCFEYGDYDNWVTMVFDSVSRDGKWYKIEFHSVFNNTKEAVYTDDNFFDVIGKEK